VTERPRVWVFFYGSYMNFDVLREVDLVPDRWEVARLAGFDLRIAHRANLVRSDGAVVYGILATATHAELARLYAHAEEILGEVYLPEAVLAETLDGTWRAALCYLCPDMEPRPADPAYVERIAAPARALGFPAWYLDRIRAFR
jgi:cation transport regulator ChaC